MIAIPASKYDSWQWRRATWAVAFALWPRRCEISDKRIWLTDAYCATSVLTGPGDPIIEHIWLTKNQYLLEVLKGTIT